MSIELINAGELSDMLGVGTGTVLRWARTGLIPCLRISNKVIRFDVNEVKKALQQEDKERNKKC